MYIFVLCKVSFLYKECYRCAHCQPYMAEGGKWLFQQNPDTNTHTHTHITFVLVLVEAI